jgi:membrane peptidoglycan carboxypeptidase
LERNGRSRPRAASARQLELWLLGYLIENPQATFNDAVQASLDERQEVYGWLFRSRHKSARDSRIRIMLEVEAFLDIHQRWQNLGYPFAHLVPSLATAIGSSGDRPAALAELMGIIQNDGIRQPSMRIDSLHFAADTPYDTLVGRNQVVGTRVMASEVAAALRNALAEVVNNGTARRLQGSFKLADGQVLRVGGKTGTGDNRIETVGAGGRVLSSRAMNRTATFVFYLGPRHYGTLTAFVPGRAAENFHFTSALPVQVLKGMAPILMPYLQPGHNSRCQEPLPAVQASWR